MDKIFITGLPPSTVIGTRPEERDLQQKIILDLEIDIDLSAASASDDLLDTINYAEIEEKMVKLAEESHFFLIEAFAQAAADIVLSYEKTTGCTVTITKPNASHRATVKVVLRREK
ncbi:MAG: dihydroneopterin aldolase [Lentisphaeria bacterium]|nr:dihydroneopterin aldolase [Lentisphaeria bacterium]